MKASRSFLKQIQKALAESIDQRTMVHLARELINDYDLHKQKKLPETFAIPRSEAADQIVTDMNRYNLIIPFLNIFFSIQFKGYMGRTYKISGFHEILKSLYDMGFSIDSKNGLVYENPTYRISRNWGVLQEGKDYTFCFMWIDIVKYSLAVKENSKEAIQRFYKDFIKIIRESVEKRNGRIWLVEGDGVLAAFHFLNATQTTVLGSIEILHRFFDYNRFENPLTEPVQIRISINNGKCEYSDNHEDTKKSEAVQHVISYEKKAEPDTIFVSRNVVLSLDEIVANELKPVTTEGIPEFYFYRLSWEER